MNVCTNVEKKIHKVSNLIKKGVGFIL